MKPDSNNEMDLLLRRLGRSAADSAQDHLDADELSSYAENALPAAARARYTEHLAECGSCRKLVAQLSSSAGVISAVETVSEPSVLRKFLASLFAPMVLRYAVPALGLIVVAVIGFTVLRRNESRDSVAQLKEPETKAIPASPEQVESPARGVAGDNSGVVESPNATTAPRGERSKEAQPAPSQTPAASGTVAAQANEAAPVTKDEQPPPASTPEAKPATPSDELQKKNAEIEARKEITNRSVSELPRARVADTSKEQDRRSDNDFRPSSAPAPQAGSVANLQRDGEVRDKIQEKGKNDAETRSVAGRRFLRERGVWIDTAYDSSRSTVNVSRDSEQYRALVADEPVIKSIAEQLDGEIIVVWKGRAYRIR